MSIRIDLPVALLEMVAPGAEFPGAPLFGPKIGKDQKTKKNEKVIAVKVVDFRSKNM